MTKCDYFADAAWLPQGWETGARVEIVDGVLRSVEVDCSQCATERLGRFVLPGMPNLHSHAFQRAIAGLTERQPNPRVPDRQGSGADGHGRSSQFDHDNFWTWRETMYAFAGRLNPDDLRAIAAQLYVEMLKAGYTHVCEFHYLHHQPDGQPYADSAAMSYALIDAARDAGVGMTLLPVLYMTGGFDGRALSERQRRFGQSIDAYLELLCRLQKMQNSTLCVGVALHSLRAVPEEAMRLVLESGLVDAAPIHIHIAEQIGEVQDCLALRNARPVEWLLDHAPVDPRWCLVHATHMTQDEIRRAAATGAVAGLCPTTEANLGDGLFPLKAWLDADGRIGIGSDSHISVSPVEELRWLEYGRRLVMRHRNIAASAICESTGESLWGDALFGGAQAAGVNIGAIQTAVDGESQTRADLLVLDDDAPLLAARSAENATDTFIFAGNSNLVRHVMVAGEWVVRDFHHRDEQRIATRYRDVVERLAREQ